MEGAQLKLARTLLRKPRVFNKHHFSNPGDCVVISAEIRDLGTTTRLREIHNIGRAAKKTKATPPKALSRTPAAIRKRNSRRNVAVREKEKERARAAYAKKKLESTTKERLASNRNTTEPTIVEVKMKKTALTPFASPDECEGHYILEKRTVWTKEVFMGHKFIPNKKGTTPRAIGANTSILKIEFDSNNKAKAEALSIL